MAKAAKILERKPDVRDIPKLGSVDGLRPFVLETLAVEVEMGARQSRAIRVRVWSAVDVEAHQDDDLPATGLEAEL